MYVVITTWRNRQLNHLPSKTTMKINTRNIRGALRALNFAYLCISTYIPL